MRGDRALPPARPFFMETVRGQRFCIYHAANPATAHRGAILHVHPFGEEINRARRVTALQARAFAAMGFAVLQIDLFGCGDSSGLLSDASWALWKQDLHAAQLWLEQNNHPLTVLWGVRLGAALALDFAKDAGVTVETLLLWQPVFDGRAYINQLLRLRLAAEMSVPSLERKIGTSALRAALAAGEVIEIAGYDLTPAIAADIDAIDASLLTLPDVAIHWMEIVNDAAGSPPPGRSEIVNRCIRSGVDMRMHAVPCAPFWSTADVVECEPLIEETGKIFSMGSR